MRGMCWTNGEPRMCLYLVPKLVLHRKLVPFSFIYWDPLVSTVLMLYPLKSISALPKGRFKGCKKERWISPPHTPTHTPIPPSHLSPRLKASSFQRKRLYTKREGEKKRKFIHPFVFFLQTAAVSHIASPIHTLRAVAASKIYLKMPHGTSPTHNVWNK